MRTERLRAPLALSFAVSTLLGASAQARDLAAFDAFLRANAKACLAIPSIECFDRSFAHVDEDGDRGLSLDEADRLRNDLADWLASDPPGVPPADRQAVALGLWMVDLAGLDALHRSFDENGDGRLDKNELTRDVALDERPLPEIANDPEAVDWAAIAERLGAAGALLDRLKATGGP